MSPDILAMVIATTIEVLASGAGVLPGWKLSETLRQMTAEVTFNVFQGRPIREVLREMCDSPGGMRESPAQ